MVKRIFARMKGYLLLFAGSIALLAITLMLDFKTFEQFNFYRDVDVWTHPILLFQLTMVAIVLLMLGQVIGLSVKYYFAFKKLDALFPNNEWERKDFKEKADYVDEKFEAMIVKEVLIFYGSHFTVIPLKELKEIHLYRTSTGRRVYYGIKFMFKKKRRSFIPNTYGKTLEDGYRLVRKVNYFVPVKIKDDWKNVNRK
ncbi:MULTISPECIES: hypothetical protein [unclassified Granulicatella]|jgi:hypothetical protein|uniref:hypothetical protein n=1 Tax=unclassified Granulicatella TaxID=2630493 RepID=UPI002554997A|nr:MULTISPECIES: hypothetical protein [unclassified Granulicatella]MDK8380096.1 hypothetical protein [Granulicatella sp. UMB5615B]MDK8522476.1 hypothetical protein [Granulicatella sp. UMB5615A]